LRLTKLSKFFTKKIFNQFYVKAEILKKTAVQLQKYALLNTSTHKLEITEMKNSLLTDTLSVTSFQQDNAPAHRARETVEFLSRKIFLISLHHRCGSQTART